MKRVPDYIVRFSGKLCMKSEMRHKLSAVVFDNKGRVINSDYNRWLRIGVNGFRTSIHAEEGAILGCSRSELWGSSIFVYRRNGALAMPCHRCMAIIQESGIKQIFWSNGIGGIDSMRY